MVPHLLQQSLAKNTTGTWQVRAQHLLPDKWSSLEKSVGVGVYNPTDNGARLFINYYGMPTSVELKARVTLNGTGTATPYNFSGTGDVDITMVPASPDLPYYSGTGAATYESWTYTPQNPGGGCTATATTKNGQLFSQMIPDSTRLGNMQLFVAVTAGGPTEHYTDCHGSSDFARLWFTWLNQDDAHGLVNFQIVAPGHAQRVIDETFDSGEAQVTEHVVLDLYITP